MHMSFLACPCHLALAAVLIPSPVQLDALKAEATTLQQTALEEARRVARSGSMLADAGDGSSASSVAELQARLRQALEVMGQGLVERETEVRLLVLAAVAGEHMLYIGPPGTAKSEMGRRLSRLCRGTYFERLLTRFSVSGAGGAADGTCSEKENPRETGGWAGHAHAR
jgi:hypothetical protein